MPTATLTSKGQITLPREVREKLGLHRGDQVEFLLDPDGSVHLRPLKLSVRTLSGFLHRPGKRPVSLEEMEESLLEQAAQADRLGKEP